MARRAGTPALSLHPKPVISVEEWEAQAPLGDIEIRSVNAVKAAVENVPLPLKFVAQEAGPSRPATPVQRNKLVASGSRPATPSRTSHELHPKQPIQTPQQFYDWFALIDRSVAHSQESHFRAHVASVAEHLNTCDFLVERIDEVEKEVDAMMEGWKGVEEGGKSLKLACERLLEERDKLLELTDDITSRLEYFQELEHATRMLNHPGEALIFQADFLYMVERVDICIDFLKAHRLFREADVYLLRFQQCMTRTMTLIKMNFVGSLRALAADISKRLSEKDMSPTLQQHLLYNRFSTVSSRIAPLLGELERRAHAYPAELSALLAECHTAYFSARRQLLTSRVMEEIKGLDPGGSELVELTRTGCSFLKQLCTDEFDLYRTFFSTGEEQLYQYLETLCDLLYDDLRPRILHEPRITALCEVCTVLQALMVLDVPGSATGAGSSAQNARSGSSEQEEDSDEEEDDDEDDDNDELTMDLDARKTNHGLKRLHIGHLLQMVLQDAQTRLFFKAQAVIQSEVRYYVPKEGDLKYPELLIDARGPRLNTDIREKESKSQLFQFLPSVDRRDTWYPTLQKTVWVLEQLHDFVKPAIFEDIAQESLDFTRQSLVSASELIKTRSSLDAQLFLVRHMLILREIIQGLDLHREGSVPLNSISQGSSANDTWASVLGRTTSSLLPESVYVSLGMRGNSITRGAGNDIDIELRRSCEDVISLCAGSVCTPLQSWIDQVHLHGTTDTSNSKENSTSSPSTKELATQEAITNLNNSFKEAIDRQLRASVMKLRLYLEDDRTVKALLEHVRDQIMDVYTEFRQVAVSVYPGTLRVELLSRDGVREAIMSAFEFGESSGISDGN